MPYQVQGIDLPSIFLAAQQARQNEQAYRLNEMKMAEAQRHQEAAAQLPFARRDYFAGNASPLAQIAPEEFTALQKAQAERAKLQAEAQVKATEGAQARQPATVNYLVRAIDHLKTNPGSYGQVVGQINQLAQQGIINPVQLPDAEPDPATLDQMRASLLSTMPQKPTTEATNAAIAYGQNPADPATWENKDVQAELRGGGAIKTAEREKALRTQFDSLPEVKGTKEILSAYNNAMSTGDTPAGHLSLVFAYMKLLDPGASVMEGDVANASNTTGLGGRIYNIYNSVLNGNRLTPEQIRDFRGQAQSLLNSRMKVYGTVANEYKRLATEQGLKPENIVLPLGYSPGGKEKQRDSEPPPPAPTADAPSFAQQAMGVSARREPPPQTVTPPAAAPNQRTAQLADFVQARIGKKDAQAIVNEARMKLKLTPDEARELLRQINAATAGAGQ